MYDMSKINFESASAPILVPAGEHDMIVKRCVFTFKDKELGTVDGNVKGIFVVLQHPLFLVEVLHNFALFNPSPVASTIAKDDFSRFAIACGYVKKDGLFPDIGSPSDMQGITVGVDVGIEPHYSTKLPSNAVKGWFVSDNKTAVSAPGFDDELPF